MMMLVLYLIRGVCPLCWSIRGARPRPLAILGGSCCRGLLGERCWARDGGMERRWRSEVNEKSRFNGSIEKRHQPHATAAVGGYGRLMRGAE